MLNSTLIKSVQLNKEKELAKSSEYKNTFLFFFVLLTASQWCNKYPISLAGQFFQSSFLTVGLSSMGRSCLSLSN